MARCVVVVAMLHALAGAQVVFRVTGPAAAGIDSGALSAAVDLWRRAVAEDEVRGVVLVVVRDGALVLHEALGYRVKEESAAMPRDALFRLASNTKPMVATVALRLVEEGRLCLDDPVARRIPAFATSALAPVTVRHLLSHTGGIDFDGIFVTPILPPTETRSGPPSLRREVERFAAFGLREPPGTVYRYSNAGYNTLGAVLEAASGQPLAELLRETVFAPVGMASALTHEPEADPRRMCRVYRKSKKGWITEWSPGDPPAWPFVRASGGGICTALDYARFCQVFLDGGRAGPRRVLTEASVKMAVSPQSPAVASRPASERGGAERTRHGFGFVVRSDGVFGHGGSDGTDAWIDPARRVIGITFTQSPGGAAPLEAFRCAVLAACRD